MYYFGWGERRVTESCDKYSTHLGSWNEENIVLSSGNISFWTRTMHRRVQLLLMMAHNLYRNMWSVTINRELVWWETCVLKEFITRVPYHSILLQYINKIYYQSILHSIVLQYITRVYYYSILKQYMTRLHYYSTLP